MEDHIWPPRDHGRSTSFAAEIGGNGFDFACEPVGPRGRHDVQQRDAINVSAATRLAADQVRNKLAPDHAGRASDEDVHAMKL
jgi:hypothetical protein